jgi:NAD(P)-dependent dehydrogenase (short-subunit alcohol dehydrogenase family)
MQNPRSVVITGASTGIGRACAIHMDRMGWHVFAGVRTQADAESLRREATNRLTPLYLDVTNSESIEKAYVAVSSALDAAGLCGLVNNAGIAYGGPVELLDLDEMRRGFEVNFFGMIAVTQAFLPQLRLGRGRIINMSSISGMVASPFLSPYSTSKWAMEALSDILRVELHQWDIKVSVVQPGAIDTPIWDKGLNTAKSVLEKAPSELMELYIPSAESWKAGLRPHGIPAENVAKAVAHALTSSRPKSRYPIGLQGRVVSIFKHLPDGVRDFFFLRRIRKGL